MKVEVVDIGSYYINNLRVEYPDEKISKGENLSNDKIISACFVMSNAEFVDLTDEQISEIYFTLDYDNTDQKKYTFNAIYDYYFEYNGETLYICLGTSVYVPYE